MSYYYQIDKCFFALGKRNYMDICLNVVYKKYGELDYATLQEISCNSSVCYHQVADYRGYKYTVRAMDEDVENINYWAKVLPLQSDVE